MKNHRNPIGILRSTRNRCQGFSLVELLVVITIIVVLAGLTMSITQRIRAKARQANAMSSLRQVAAFNAAYSAENNGDINTLRDPTSPKEGNNLKGIGDAWVKNTFWGRLQPLLFPDISVNNQKKLGSDLNSRLDVFFNSPDADKMLNTVISGARIYHDGSGLPVPFAFNKNLYDWREYVKISSVSDPSQVIYMVYGFYFFDQADGAAYVERPKTQISPTNNIYYLDDKSVLAAFIDGHIESVSAPISERRFK